MSLYIYGWDPLTFESRLPFRGPARDCERPLMRPEQFAKVARPLGVHPDLGGSVRANEASSEFERFQDNSTGGEGQ